jgi:NAD(P)H-dependent flavin oxidoreductase YrpB (nitropropane dioxygenase family)
MDIDALFHTPLCERLKIKYPVFQAGMGFVAEAELTAAVSNAGGRSRLYRFRRDELA